MASRWIGPGAFSAYGFDNGIQGRRRDGLELGLGLGRWRLIGVMKFGFSGLELGFGS
jgi:hypothetical protein